MPQATKLEMIEWNRGKQLQSETNAGFCGTCGEGCRPFHSRCPQELKDTACEYNGKHPSCGGPHDLVFVEETPASVGSFKFINACALGAPIRRQYSEQR